ncbi:PPE domain-containing protein [Umezawaea sp. Da 62-37]|uniref:PPE domain-containing protein n=1 Tax=Umezawaea sp. Da 62-37 TaxID=3075927 RepID=UPI0028F6C217|nr:PPE domain-containing protein [Umezawaea sp. Da 62-37]WNV83748.1 PPE domain-containing protein [Umezawaea sp. Da 62-37]
MPVGNHNFDAQSHGQLYDRIHNGADAGAAQATNDAWLNFRAVMANAKANVDSALQDAKVSWTGAASDSFGGGMAPLVQWAENARAAGVDSHNAFQTQQSYYTGTRERMPAPVQVSSTANDDFFGIPAAMTHLVGGQTDQDVEEQKALEAKREAVRIMTGYQGGAAEAVSRVGMFTPPPTVTVDVPAPRVEQSLEQRQYSQEFSARFGAGETSSSTAPAMAAQSPSQSSTAAPPPGSAPQASGSTPPQGAQDSTRLSGSIAPPVAHPSPVTTPSTTPVPHPNAVHAVGMPGGVPRRDAPGGTSAGGRGGGGAGAGSGGRGGTGSPGASGFGGSTASGRPGQPDQADRSGPQAGRGTSSGITTTEPHAGFRPGFAGAKGAAGTAGMGMGGVPQGARDEEDGEHKAAEYLQELDDVWGENDVLVAPPVIGDDQR